MSPQKSRIIGHQMKFIDSARHIKTEGSLAIFRLDDRATLEITALEPTLFRVSVKRGHQFIFPRTWSIAWEDIDVPPEGRSRESLAGFSYPQLRFKSDAEGWQLSVDEGGASLRIHQEPFYLQWLWQGRVALSERPTGALALGVRDQRHQHFHDLPADAQIFGLGEKAGPLDKRGMKFEMRNVDAMGYDAERTDPLYKHFPFLIQRTKGVSTGLFYDSFATSTFDMGREIDNYHRPFFSYLCANGDLDYYIIFGPQVSDVSRSFTRLTGRPMLPPKWSLSYSGSTMTYTDSDNADAELRGFLKKIDAHALPCRSFHLSSGYTSIGKKRYVFHWNRSKIPDPKALVDAFRTCDVRLIPNIKPVLLSDHPLFDQAKTSGLFIRDSESLMPERSQFWDGKGSHLDFSNPDTRTFWRTQIREQLLHFGIDSLWNDNNEYEVWDDDTSCAGDGAPWPIKYGRAIQTLLMAMTSRQALLEERPHERPFVVSRSGMPGMQRYVQTWSGDNRTDWKTLRFNLAMALNLSLSGVSNTGHDIGGFSGPLPEPELFLRWIQHGIFYPRFVIHSWKEGGRVNEPWMYPVVLPLVQDAFKLREQLLPYYYDLLKNCEETFCAFLRPLFYDFERDEQTFTQTDTFMVGPSLLVATVLSKSVDRLNVYLPQNETGWFHFTSQRWYAGGTTVELAIDLSSIPIFVRANSMLPLKTDGGGLELRFYPNHTASSGVQFAFAFHDDDGISFPTSEFMRLSGEFSLAADGSADVKIARAGVYKPAYDRVTVTANGAHHVKVNGEQTSTYLLAKPFADLVAGPVKK